jgi:hypothetical protein
MAAADAAAERRVANVKRDEKFALSFWAANEADSSRDVPHRVESPAKLSPTIVYASYGQPRLTAAEIRAITSIVDRRLRGRDQTIISMERTFEGAVEVRTTSPGAEGVGLRAAPATVADWRLVDSHLWQN